MTNPVASDQYSLGGVVLTIAAVTFDVRPHRADNLAEMLRCLRRILR
jgi:hypothetical protein